HARHAGASGSVPETPLISPLRAPRTLPGSRSGTDIRVRPGSFRLPSRRPARHHGPMTDHQHTAAGPGGATAAPPETPGGPGPADPDHRLRRDRRHQMLGGVCAGLGRQCDMDPVIFRITLAVLSATGGIGLI